MAGTWGPEGAAHVTRANVADRCQVEMDTQARQWGYAKTEVPRGVLRPSLGFRGKPVVPHVRRIAHEGGPRRDGRQVKLCVVGPQDLDPPGACPGRFLPRFQLRRSPIRRTLPTPRRDLVLAAARRQEARAGLTPPEQNYPANLWSFAFLCITGSRREPQDAGKSHWGPTRCGKQGFSWELC
jgi:hypothetical protein